MIKNKYLNKKVKILYILFFIIILIIILLLFYSKSYNPNKEESILEHPLKNIVLANTNKLGVIDKEKLMEQAIIDFDEDYVNYLSLSLGINKLHNSNLGHGNPKIKFVLDNEIWSIEIIDNNLLTKKHDITEEDIVIKTTKEDIIHILLSQDVKSSIENSLKSGNIKIEIIANKLELISKGYLEIYKKINS